MDPDLFEELTVQDGMHRVRQALTARANGDTDVANRIIREVTGSVPASRGAIGELMMMVIALIGDDPATLADLLQLRAQQDERGA